MLRVGASAGSARVAGMHGARTRANRSACLRRRTVTALLCLIGTMLAAGGGATTALGSSTPEFTGSYPNSLMGVGKTSEIESVAGLKVLCKRTVDTGAVTGPTTITAELTFNKCTLGKLVCHNPLEKVIRSRLLEGAPGLLGESLRGTGIDLAAQGGGPLVEFECTTAKVKKGQTPERDTIKIEGSVVGTWDYVRRTHFQQSFEQAAGIQRFRALDGGDEDVLRCVVNGLPPVACALGSYVKGPESTPVGIIGQR